MQIQSLWNEDTACLQPEDLAYVIYLYIIVILLDSNNPLITLS